MNLFLIIFAVALVAMFFNSVIGTYNLELILKSKGNRSDYVVIRKNHRRGYKLSDWEYYESDMTPIIDERLKRIIFNTFVNEDWYGDYVFYVDDVEYLGSINVTEEDMLEEEGIIKKIMSDEERELEHSEKSNKE